MTPQEFSIIKDKIQTSTILTETEKKEWLFLLPKMSGEQIKELDRILSVKLPNTQVKSEAALPPAVAPTRPLVVSDLRPIARKETIITKQAPPHPSPVQPNPLPAYRQAGRLGEREIVKVSLPTNPQLTVFSALALTDLRAAPSIYIFLEELKKKILAQKETGTALPEILAAFEKSPLYRLYLDSGTLFLNGKPARDLSHEEFEAIADFRASLKKLW